MNNALYLIRGAAPETLGFIALAPEPLSFGAASAAPAVPASESTLGSHPCVALSSAQVLTEWTTATTPCNDLSTNGNYPLNLLSQSRGPLHCAPAPPFTLVPGSNDPSFSAECPTNFFEFSRPFPGNYIPLSRLGDPFAFLIGPSQQTDPVVPEPANIYLIGIALGVTLLFILRNKTEPRPEEEAVATSSISSSDPATIKY